MVGSFEDLEEAPPIPKGVLQVFVSGEGVSGSRASGVDRSLGGVLYSFRPAPAVVGGEETSVAETRRAGGDEEIGIALHGLDLEPDAEAELHDLIRGRIREHLA